MFGLDTNVLLRHLLQDDERQSAEASAFINAHCASPGSAFVSIIVLCEIVSMLGRGFHYSRQDIARVIDALLETAAFVIEAEDLVEKALAVYRGGNIDLPDILMALVNARNGCMATVSFDRALIVADLARPPVE